MVGSDHCHCISIPPLLAQRPPGSLGFGDELVGVVPVLQQVGGLLVVHPDVVVLKQAREEVVDLSGHIQDVAHPAGQTGRGGLTLQTFRDVIGSATARVSGFPPWKEFQGWLWCYANENHRGRANTISGANQVSW